MGVVRRAMILVVGIQCFTDIQWPLLEKDKFNEVIQQIAKYSLISSPRNEEASSLKKRRMHILLSLPRSLLPTRKIMKAEIAAKVTTKDWMTSPKAERLLLMFCASFIPWPVTPDLLVFLKTGTQKPKAPNLVFPIGSAWSRAHRFANPSRNSRWKSWSSSIFRSWSLFVYVEKRKILYFSSKPSKENQQSCEKIVHSSSIPSQNMSPTNHNDSQKFPSISDPARSIKWIFPM